MAGHVQFTIDTNTSHSAHTIDLILLAGRAEGAAANFAHRLDEGGADGLVLFNRFYQPDIDPLVVFLDGCGRTRRCRGTRRPPLRRSGT
jgi:hypothetical protein